MTEPVSNPYKLPHICKTCQQGIWDKDGCYCDRVPSKTHKVCETGTCEHWALNQYIETDSEEMNKCERLTEQLKSSEGGAMRS